MFTVCSLICVLLFQYGIMFIDPFSVSLVLSLFVMRHTFNKIETRFYDLSKINISIVKTPQDAIYQINILINILQKQSIKEKFLKFCIFVSHLQACNESACFCKEDNRNNIFRQVETYKNPFKINNIKNYNYTEQKLLHFIKWFIKQLMLKKFGEVAISYVLLAEFLFHFFGNYQLSLSTLVRLNKLKFDEKDEFS